MCPVHAETLPWVFCAIEENRAELNNLSKEHPEKLRELNESWEKVAERTYIHSKPEVDKKKH